MIVIRRVNGESMLPTLPPGKVVVGLRTRRVQPGDVVVIRHSQVEKIKRVQSLEQDSLFVVGDNPGSSTDSRSFGWLPASVLKARVIWPRGLRRSGPVVSDRA